MGGFLNVRVSFMVLNHDKSFVQNNLKAEMELEP